MITKEEYVSFETAKLLKEKGFNWGCHACYLIIGEHTGERQYLANTELKNTPRGTNFNWDGGAWISCPTQQMAIRWLREIHNIHVVLNPTEIGMYEAYCIKPGESPKGFFKRTTYEKAAEVIIQYSSKLIK